MSFLHLLRTDESLHLCSTKLSSMEAHVREQLQKEVSDTFQDLISTLSAFKEEQFNLVPYEGSWTPGQIAEHLIKSVSAIPDEHTRATQRPYDERVAPIGEL